MSDVPDGWVVRESRSHGGRKYYFNTSTGESSWERPATDQVRASHILIKHRGSRRTSSWKDRDGLEIKARTKEVATEQLSKLRAQIESKTKTFSEIASIVSDCSSAEKGGDLGFFGRGQMQKPFEDTTFALAVGAMSGIIETDSGVHIILRTA